jgi:antitoxin (DNA-binding transcriptional repressor) of toxin-antitoxin stability system
MRTISSTELKTRLGRYTKLAHGGETIAITIRGKIVGFLKPLLPEDTQSSPIKKRKQRSK